MRLRRQLFRPLFFLFLLTCLFTALVGIVRVPVQAAPNAQWAIENIIISEFRLFGNSGLSDQFVEIKNLQSGVGNNLNGWKIIFSDNVGNTSLIYEFTTDIILQTGASYLIANIGYDDSVLPDATYTPVLSEDGGIALLRPDNTIADQVGLSYGALYGEKTILPALNVNIDQGYKRRLGKCQDTDNNAYDFTLANPSTPQSLTSPGLGACQAIPEPGVGSIVINEVAWAGTIASSNDEWIELYNLGAYVIDISGWRLVSQSGGLDIIFPSGTFIYPSGSGIAINTYDYFLIERWEAATSVRAHLITTYPWSLNDNGEILRLRNLNGIVIDTANSNGGAWPAGSISPNGSMERYDVATDTDQSWATNNQGLGSSAKDAFGNNIHGTPGDKNWITTITTTTLTISPSLSVVGQEVTFTATVTGMPPKPQGTVDIVDITGGANTLLCTIATLTNGTGNCFASFSSVGAKLISANYKPSDFHPPSSSTAKHEVLHSTTTTITADTPDPSTVNQNVLVSVTVAGGPTIPTGKVNITGADTNCSITLDATGKGKCNVRFSSSGPKTLTATYLGDTTHGGSSDTETNQVLTPTPAPVRTPTRIPTPLPPPPPPPLIAINEFVPRPGSDWNSDGVVNTGDEYIEILNHGVISVNLSGYKLDDEANIGSNPFPLPSITLQPGERIVFYGSQTGLLLSDGGDGVRLLKPNGQLMDAYNYFIVDFPDQSFCRLPDNGGLDDWNTNCFPTPGLKNSLSGSLLRPPTQEDEDQPLCPIADMLPYEFVLAECTPFGNNIWNRFYWDKFGWYGEMYLKNVNGKWDVFAE